MMYEEESTANFRNVVYMSYTSDNKKDRNLTHTRTPTKYTVLLQFKT